MKIKTLSVLFLVILAGCASSLQGRVDQAWISFSTANEAIAIGHSAGVLSTDDVRAVIPYVDAAEAALDQADLSLATKDSNGVDVALKSFRAAFAHLASKEAAVRNAGLDVPGPVTPEEARN